jgi:phosphonate transport system ATP-binding protein
MSIVFDDVSVVYPNGTRGLDKVSLTIPAGEFVVVVGLSGAGKSTLVRTINGLVPVTSGSLSVGGTEVATARGRRLRRLRAEIGMIFQGFNLVTRRSVMGNVLTGRLHAQSWARSALGLHTKADKEIAFEALERVGIVEKAWVRASQLSGGQQQRVAIARALVHDPPLVLADEPTAHLDHIQVEGVLGLLRQLASPGRVVVVSTHDDRVTNLADRVVDLAALRPGAAIGDAEREPELLELRAGDVVFEQGSRGDLVYVVERGQVEIVRVRDDGSEERLAIVRAGEYFGELGPVLGLPRSATARAKTSAVVTGYTVRRFRQRLPVNAPS